MFKRMLLVWIATLMLSICGCKTLDWARDQWDEWTDKEEEVDPALQDQSPVPFNEIIWHGVNIGGWPIIYPMKVWVHGNGIYLDQEATKKWPSMAANVGSVWFIVKESDGKWHGYRWDQIRAGQMSREFPWNPPHPKEGENYATAKRGEEIYICLSSMARGADRTVNERTPLVPFVGHASVAMFTISEVAYEFDNLTIEPVAK
jgi:hypothetical protein